MYRRGEWERQPAVYSAAELLIGGVQAMQSWESPLMRVMAEEVCRSQGRILEVGFGMGISARWIAHYGFGSYEVIEAHPEVAEVARRHCHSIGDATVHEGPWEEVTPRLGREYDAILYDIYNFDCQSNDLIWTFQVKFFATAQKLLRPGGVLVYYSSETIDFTPAHLRVLLATFRRVELIHVGGLQPPAECDYWSADHMVVPVCHV